MSPAWEMAGANATNTPTARPLARRFILFIAFVSTCFVFVFSVTHHAQHQPDAAHSYASSTGCCVFQREFSRPASSLSGSLVEIFFFHRSHGITPHRWLVHRIPNPVGKCFQERACRPLVAQGGS